MTEQRKIVKPWSPEWHELTQGFMRQARDLYWQAIQSGQFENPTQAEDAIKVHKALDKALETATEHLAQIRMVYEAVDHATGEIHTNGQRR